MFLVLLKSHDPSAVRFLFYESALLSRRRQLGHQPK